MSADDPLPECGCPHTRQAEELRRRAERVIRGRESFEEYHLGGRKSDKPLPKIELDPRDVITMLDALEQPSGCGWAGCVHDDAPEPPSKPYEQDLP